MAELKGVGYLRMKLQQKRNYVTTRYDYYGMKNQTRYFSKLLPAEYKWLSASLGWCAKSVDSLADRLCFNRMRNDEMSMNEIFARNNSDILFDSAILSASISSCSFIYISPGANGYPRLQVIDGGNATGIIDPITMMLKEGYAVLERDSNGAVTVDAYFEPHQTTFYSGGQVTVQRHAVEYPLLVPIIHRPDAAKPFGRARITEACMELMQGAIRTIIRAEIGSEFYSFPQKYVLGMSEDAEFNNRVATYSSFINFPADEDGNRPSAGQFSGSAQTPNIEHLKMLASLFAAESGLTVDDLGFAGANPSSAEAIKASHETLRLTARKAQRSFGTGFLNAGYLARCLADERNYNRYELSNTVPAWKPIFEPDASAMSGIGDGLIKLEQAVPGTVTQDMLEDLLGINYGR